jgi:hypothetical protein
MKYPKGSPLKCSVEDCSADAELYVYLQDDYGYSIEYDERDPSCPYMCHEHAVQNDEESIGFGRERQYPFSKWAGRRTVRGWTSYRDIKSECEVVFTDHYGLPLE